jgi:hypothetical protein
MSAGDDTLPYPVKDCSYRIPMVEFKDVTGAPVTSPTGIDTESSGDFAAFADCSEAVHDAQGFGHLDLTPTEMGFGNVRVLIKGSNFVTAPYNLRPRNLPVLESGTARAGGASTITLASSANIVDGYYNGAILKTTSGTGSGQARLIVGYVGLTGVATMNAPWAVNPDSTTHYSMLETEFSIAHGALASMAEIRDSILNQDPSGYPAGSVGDKIFNSDAPVTVETNNDKTGYSLTSGERSAISSLLEAILSVASRGEETSFPAPNAPLTAKIDYLFKGLRNKRKASLTLDVVSQDNGTAFSKHDVSFDGTYVTREKGVAGP